MPSFLQVLTSLATAWETRRDEVTRVGADVAAHLGQPGEPAESAAENIGAQRSGGPACVVRRPLRRLRRRTEVPAVDGLEFLLRRAARTGDPDALAMAEGTLEAMARGGMYDQVGGGFARYSVDARWDVPHFEKMLYDNALLLRVYLHWWRQTGSALGERVARDTAEFVLRELATEEGGFASALDADSDGEEGIFYVWTPAQLVEALGERRRTVRGRRLRRDRRQATSSGARRPCASTRTRPTKSGTPPSCRGCSPLASNGPDRRATTRWSPPGTG